MKKQIYNKIIILFFNVVTFAAQAPKAVSQDYSDNRVYYNSTAIKPSYWTKINGVRLCAIKYSVGDTYCVTTSPSHERVVYETIKNAIGGRRNSEVFRMLEARYNAQQNSVK